MGLRGINGPHARAGRKLAGLSVIELASRAGLTPEIVIELEDDALQPIAVHLAIQAALEAAGIRFLFAEYDERLVVRLARGGVSAPRVIYAGCGLLKWSNLKLCRRAGIRSREVRRAFAHPAADGQIIGQCLKALSRHGCTALRARRGLWKGVELRSEFHRPPSIGFGPRRWRSWE